MSKTTLVGLVVVGALLGSCGGGGGGGSVGAEPPGLQLLDFQSAFVVMGQDDALSGSANQGVAAAADTVSSPLGSMAQGDERATYLLTVVNSWSTTSHPGNFPEDAHFSWIGGGTHNAGVSFWGVGQLASPGMVLMAESGITRDVEAEVDAQIPLGRADKSLGYRWWFCPAETTNAACGPMQVQFDVSSMFPQVTLVSMLGPSPDWFVGTQGLPLRDANGFLDEVVVPLVSYDGGTRSANQWELFGPENDPPQPVSLITAQSGQLIGPDPIGSMTFTLLPPVVPAIQFVADAGNNRVLGYASMPTVNGAEAALVLGQPDLGATDPATTGAGMATPVDVATGNGRLAVADAGNHRVLVWNAIPSDDGEVADLALGQPDLETGDPATTATGLSSPSAACIADTRLFVADRGNHRVLIWNALPTESGVPADVVVGQPDMDTGAPGTSSMSLNQPSDVWSDGQRLIVVDTGNHRVLIWNAIPTTNGAPADVVVGQADMNSATPGLGASGLSSPGAVCANAWQLFVADTGNHRVLVFEANPPSSNPEASIVLGQSDFQHSTPNDDSQQGLVDPNPTARTMNAPSGVSVVGSQLIVVDKDNHRVLVFEAQ